MVNSKIATLVAVLSFTLVIMLAHAQSVPNYKYSWVCSSFGSFPMSNGLAIGCAHKPGYSEGDMVWEGSSVLNYSDGSLYLHVLYVGGNDSNYNFTLLMVPNSRDRICHFTGVTEGNQTYQCLVVNFGTSYTMNGNEFIFTSLNGYEAHAPIVSTATP